MSCDVGEVTETWRIRMSCDVGEVTKSLENEFCYDYNYELCSFSKLSVTSPTSLLILNLQAFHHFTYITAHSPTLPSLYLRHNSFSNPSVVSPVSQLIIQPFFCFSYVTGSSLTSPGEPPMEWTQHQVVKHESTYRGIQSSCQICHHTPLVECRVAYISAETQLVRGSEPASCVNDFIILSQQILFIFSKALSYIFM